MKSHEFGKKLEQDIVNKFLDIEIPAKRSKGSGNKGSAGDIDNAYFVCECKARNTKDITIKSDTWTKLLSQIPLHSKRLPLYILRNKENLTMAVLNINDFFKILEGYLNNE